MIWWRARSAASSTVVSSQVGESSTVGASLAGGEAAQEQKAYMPKSNETSKTILLRKPVQQIRMVSQYGGADLHEIAGFCKGAVSINLCSLFITYWPSPLNLQLQQQTLCQWLQCFMKCCCSLWDQRALSPSGFTSMIQTSLGRSYNFDLIAGHKNIHTKLLF